MLIPSRRIKELDAPRFAWTPKNSLQDIYHTSTFKLLFQHSFACSYRMIVRFVTSSVAATAVGITGKWVEQIDDICCTWRLCERPNSWIRYLWSDLAQPARSLRRTLGCSSVIIVAIPRQGSHCGHTLSRFLPGNATIISTHHFTICHNKRQTILLTILGSKVDTNAWFKFCRFDSSHNCA